MFTQWYILIEFYPFFLVLRERESKAPGQTGQFLVWAKYKKRQVPLWGVGLACDHTAWVSQGASQH